MTAQTELIEQIAQAIQAADDAGENSLDPKELAVALLPFIHAAREEGVGAGREAAGREASERIEKLETALRFYRDATSLEIEKDEAEVAILVLGDKHD